MTTTESVYDGILRQVLDPTPALEWLRLNSKDYGGEWVALDGDRLIAHGPDAKEVYAAAIELADALPFVY
jgi:hypothetical protein